jgi:hypothetical protein
MRIDITRPLVGFLAAWILSAGGLLFSMSCLAAGAWQVTAADAYSSVEFAISVSSSPARGADDSDTILDDDFVLNSQGFYGKDGPPASGFEDAQHVVSITFSRPWRVALVGRATDFESAPLVEPRFLRNARLLD